MVQVFIYVWLVGEKKNIYIYKAVRYISHWYIDRGGNKFGTWVKIKISGRI